MARFKFGRPISLRWNGLLIEGPAETVFEIPDEYYEEFEEDIHPVEPTLVWLDTDEGETIRDRLDVLEAGGGGVSLSSDLPLALGTAAAGTGTEASRDDHVHPTTGLALSGHNHSGVYDPAGTAASAVAAHEAASDPHPTYLTDAEGDAQYSQLGHTHATVDRALQAEATVYLVRNNTGSTISKGTLVSAVGAEPSGRIDVAPFEVTGLQDSELQVMGLATENISTGVNGTVISFGTLTGIDTRGTSASAVAVGDEDWDEGTILYAHPTVPGKLTEVRPQHDLPVAFTTVRHASTGQLAVRITPGNNHLAWLHDVSANSPSGGDLIQYNGTTSIWENKSISSAGIASSSHNHAGVYDPAGTAASAISAHEAAADPHPTYLTSTEGNAAYSAAGHAHAGVYDPSGTAAAAITAHEAASDPHPTYLTSAEGNSAYEQFGSVSSHNSATTSVHGITNTANLLTTSTSFANFATGGASATTIASTTSTSPTDISGMTVTFTPTYNEDVIVHSNLVFTQSAQPTSTCDIISRIIVNGTIVSPYGGFTRLAANHSSPTGFTQSQTHVFAATAGTSYTVKTAAYKTAATGTFAASNISAITILRVRA